MRAYIISILFLIPVICWGQQAEQIYSIAKKHFPIDYYHTQAGLWKNKIDQRANDAEAWDNYYAACRMANLSTKGKDKPYDLDEIVSKAAETIPNVFEYHKIAHWNTNDLKKDWYHLQQAYAIDPDRSDIYEGLIAHYVLQNDKENIALFNKKLFESGNTSPGILAWNYNQLMSVEENAILLTYGDTDTYPAWLIQAAKGVRPQVTILNIHLLMRAADYRKTILDKFNIPAIAVNGTIDFSQRTDFTVKLVNQLATKTNRPIYLGVGMDRGIISQLESNLYLVGLAFKYSPTKFDNIPQLKNNIENKFMLDHLRLYLHIDHSESLLDQINGLYLPALVMMYKQYDDRDKNRKLALGELIDRIAQKSGMEAFANQLKH